MICILGCGMLLLALVHQHNRVTVLQLEIPQLKQCVRDLQSENVSLQFEVAYSESPVHLLEWAQEARFKQYTFPQQEEVVFLP